MSKELVFYAFLTGDPWKSGLSAVIDSRSDLQIRARHAFGMGGSGFMSFEEAPEKAFSVHVHGHETEQEVRTTLESLIGDAPHSVRDVKELCS